MSIDYRRVGDTLIFRASLKDNAGDKVTTGTTSLRLFSVQSDGSLLSYDFNDNTFKSGALTTATLAMTHRTGNNGTYDTGYWTAVLSTLTGLTFGDLILAQVTNTGASPESQEREFVYGTVDSNMQRIADGQITGLNQIAEAVDTEITSNHGAGSYQTADVSNLDATISSRASQASVDGLNNFDPSSDTVNVDQINGVSVAGPDDFKANLTGIPSAVDAEITANHGAGSYQTATGFSEPGDEMALTTAAINATAAAVGALSPDTGETLLTSVQKILSRNDGRLTVVDNGTTITYTYRDRDDVVLIEQTITKATGARVTA